MADVANGLSAGVSSWRLVGGSVIGAGHAQSGQPCQDAHACRALGDDWAVAAVGDGLGSAALAGRGAEVAVAAVLDALADALGGAKWPPAEPAAPMTVAFAAARAALVDEAAALAVPLAALATTLIAVAWGPDRLLVGHVGDGAVVGAWGDHLRTVSAPQRGEYANVTVPLTAADALAQARYGLMDVPDALALFSDGLQGLALDTRDDTPFAGFCGPLLAGIGRVRDVAAAESELAAFLGSSRVNARTDDDKTLVLMGRAAERPPVVLPPRYDGHL